MDGDSPQKAGSVGPRLQGGVAGERKDSLAFAPALGEEPGGGLFVGVVAPLCEVVAVQMCT